MNDLSFLMDYVNLVVTGICLISGAAFKHAIEKFPNKYIPAVVCVEGVILAYWTSGWQFTPEILLTGLVSGIVSIGCHQLLKQTTGWEV